MLLRQRWRSMPTLIFHWWKTRTLSRSIKSCKFPVSQQHIGPILILCWFLATSQRSVRQYPFPVMHFQITRRHNFDCHIGLTALSRARCRLLAGIVTWQAFPALESSAHGSARFHSTATQYSILLSKLNRPRHENQRSGSRSYERIIST